MASMRNWLHGGELHGPSTTTSSGAAAANSTDTRNDRRVVVVHCKAGKGRSGTVGCSYMIAEEGWRAEEALARFTQRRMRPMFGAGVSIPSQLRWVSYVQRWADHGKKYKDGPIEIVEVHVWGLRDGVKVDVEGFADDGKRIQVLHTFSKEERCIVRGDAPEGGGLTNIVWDMAGYSTGEKAPDDAPFSEGTNNEVAGGEGKASSDDKPSEAAPKLIDKRDTKASKLAASRSSTASSASSKKQPQDAAEPGGQAVIFRPSEPIQVSNSDVNISVERRNRTHKSIGLTMVSAVAHVWINTFFEGNGPEQDGKPDDSGVFTIDWDAMDGIKGSSRKGTRALDRMSVVWRSTAAKASDEKSKESDSAEEEPKKGEPVRQFTAANWQGPLGVETEGLQDRDLGLRVQSPASVDVSKASSIKSEGGGGKKDTPTDGDGDGEALKGVKSCGPSGEELDAEELETKGNKA